MISAPNDIITVVRDPRNPLGKKFAADGKKSANVMLSFGIARQVHVPDAAAMVKVLKEVADDVHAALINASFPSIPVGEDFLILSEARLKKELKVDKREDVLGVHQVKHQGRTYKAVARFKENVKPSSWQLLDRDVDAHTPANFATMSHDQWLEELFHLIPGLREGVRITVPSASGRVKRNGKPLGVGGHTWFQAQDGEQVERAREILKLRAMELGYAWQKPCYSRRDPNEIVRHSVTHILDLSVWTAGRLVFDGKPSVSAPCTVTSLKPKVSPGGRVDLSALPSPSSRQVAEVSARYGTSMRIRHGDSGRLVVDVADLTLETEIELEAGKLSTIGDALESLAPDAKLRCQSPFRESSSFAAFLSRGRSGKPFIHDVGTNITHWLDDEGSQRIGLPCFSDDSPKMEELVQSFDQIDDVKLKQEYADLVVRLSGGEREEIFAYVRGRLGISKSVFNAALKEAGETRRREALQREIGSRKVIAYAPDQITVMSRTVESIIDTRIPIERYHVFGGRPSQIVPAADMGALVTHSGGPTSTRYVLKPLDEVAVRGVVEEVAVFQLAKGNDPKNICVPEKVIDTLLRSSEHTVRPIRGLLTHPIVLGNGKILAAPGYDQTTGLYLCGEQLDNVKPYTQPQARQALKRIKQRFLADMQFKSNLDADVAVAALLTGVQRRVLDQAPGIAILAPIQASGKTTLARRIHITLTGYDMPVTSFPLNNETELQKSLLAALSSSPEMICLDNITDGITFSSASLSSAITSIGYTQRKLGVSEELSCLTNTLFVLTGNNISFGADEVSRWLTITLDPQTARPQERRFQHPDVVRHALGFRPDVLRDCVGILAGFRVHGQVTAPTTRFARWDEMVRQPLMWAGGRDPAESFRNNEEKSEIGGASVALLVNLKKLFGNRRFRAYDLVSVFGFGAANTPPEFSAMAEALSRLKARELKSASSVGRALASVKDRHIATNEGTLVLRGSLNCGNQEYWVETC